MTLIISAANSELVAQVSDRRLSFLDGKSFFEDANKMIIFECTDGFFAVGYTGPGYLGEYMTDDWIMGTLEANKVAKRNMGFAVEVLRFQLTKKFETLPNHEKGYLGLSIIGWHYKKKRMIPYLSLINNEVRYGIVGDKFKASWSRMKRDARPGSASLISVDGVDEVIDQKTLERFVAEMKGESNGNSIVQKLVSFIKTASDDPKYGKFVNKNIVSFLAPRKGDLTIEYFSETNSVVSYTPHVLGGNLTLHKSEMYGANFGFRFANRTVVVKRNDDSVRPQNFFGLRSQRNLPKKP